MNLEDLIDETRERLGETTEADFFTDAEITRAINQGLQRFSNEEQWPWLFTEFSDSVVADVETLNLPSNIAINRVFGLNISETGTLAGGQMLERVQPLEGFALKHAYQDHTGLPRWYYISHTNLEGDSEPPVVYTAKVIPTPDQEYDVTGIYMIAPPLLSANEEEPALPVEYQDALPAYAAGVLFLKELSISQKASEQFALYNAILANATRETKRFNNDEVVAWGRNAPHMNSRWGVDIRSRLPNLLGQ